MNNSSDNFWLKVLLWGGGGLLLLLLLGGILDLLTAVLSFPFHHPWAFLAFGGIGYYLYRRHKKSQQTNKQYDETEDFDDIDEDIYEDF